MKTLLPVEKNQITTITIEDIGNAGEGIGKKDGFTIFVEGALPGDTVEIKILKVKKSFAYGKLLNIIIPSENRVSAPCPYASQCGGCQLQHLSYPAQLQFKTKKVQNNLERIGNIKDAVVLPAIGMDTPYFYRNKAQFPVSSGKNKIEIGFFAPRSHRIINITHCMLQKEVNDQILAVVRNFLTENKISAYDELNHKGLVRHILTRIGFTTGEIMVCLVLNGNSLPHSDKLIERLKQIKGMTSISINFNQEKTNVILGKQIKLLWGKKSITDFIGPIQFEISPLSFFQVNPVQTHLLYEKALSLAQLTGEETVLDLYCGIGTISLFFAQKAKKVLGIEVVPEAIQDAKKNADLNHINHAEFRAGLVEELIPDLYEKEGFYADIVVVDPPRKGCDSVVLKTLLSMAPPKIIYISCDSATFSRDARFLCENGYLLGEVQPVDQFCHTTHIECVVLMSKKT